MTTFAVSLVLSLAACQTPVAEPVATPITEPVVAAPAAPAATGWSHFGSEFTTQDTLTAATFLADPSPYVGKTVRVEGKVTDVCQKAGCWMVIADGTRTLRVRMKDHGFSVDKAGAGATASIEGQVVATPVDPKTVEHYASESAAGAAMPENSSKDGMVYEIEATSVAMKRG